jgi:hypothetical protein
MIKLALQPAQANYKATDGVEVITNQLDGGRGRYRRDILNSSSIVVAQWSCMMFELDYVRAFFRTASKSGSLPFLADLVLNHIDLTEVVCNFVPGTMQLTCVGGANYAVTATLEVQPDEADEDYDNGLVSLVGAFGFDGIDAGVLALEHLVNVDIPAAVS